jgi:hypothetical protein
VRWTGSIVPAFSEAYTFYTASDDGVRLWINNQLIIDKWIDQPRTEWKGTITLNAGEHYSIRLEYYENRGDASISLLWSSASQPKQVVPEARLFPEDSNGEQPKPPPTGDGLQGQYYNDKNHTQLLLTRVDATINFDWKRSSPHTSLPVDEFSVRWTGSIVPAFSEAYTFYTASDDGVRLWINNQLIIDKWIDQPRTEWKGTITLNAGEHYPIRLEYYENRGNASISLLWSSASQPKQVVPEARLFPEDSNGEQPKPPPTGDGLQGQYYNDKNHTQLLLTRVDATINFDWERSSPHTSLPIDVFSVRWTGTVVPAYSEEYTFYTASDDGVRLWINNQLIIDKWIDQPRTEWKGTITLNAGEHYPIRLEYYENRGNASISLLWSSASQPKQVIPQSQLFSE